MYCILLIEKLESQVPDKWPPGSRVSRRRWRLSTGACLRRSKSAASCRSSAAWAVTFEPSSEQLGKGSTNKVRNMGS